MDLMDKSRLSSGYQPLRPRGLATQSRICISFSVECCHEENRTIQPTNASVELNKSLCGARPISRISRTIVLVQFSKIIDENNWFTSIDYGLSCNKLDIVVSPVNNGKCIEKSFFLFYLK